MGFRTQMLLSFLIEDGFDIGGVDLLTTISSFPTSPTDPTVPAFVGRDFPEVTAPFLRVRSTAGDSGKAIGEFQAFTTVLLGDVNLDGVVNFLDISPFISILSVGEFPS